MIRHHPVLSVVTVFIALALVLWFFHRGFAESVSPAQPPRFWQVQSVDTMKMSRDGAEGSQDQADINAEVKTIAETGATHVAVGVPYDEDFVPRLAQWVLAARNNHLSVWFRGNFASWEGWFGHDKNMTQDQHVEATKQFILKHPTLFADGDIFTSCPECENGAQGDPRQSGDVVPYRAFLIRENQVAQDAFATIGKKVTTNYNSMNGDVARLVMDQPTTQALGGIVTIDHYVDSTDKLVSDTQSLAIQSGGKIVLGEFGAPIPDLNGNMTEDQQAAWLQDVLTKLLDHPEVVSVNYWTDRGSTTSLWNDDGSPRKAATVLREFFNPVIVDGTIKTSWGKPVAGASVNYLSRSFLTDKNGKFSIPFVQEATGDALVTAPGFNSITISSSAIISAEGNGQQLSAAMTRSNASLTDIAGDMLDRATNWFVGIFSKK
jgi:hypothetical protein